MYPLYYNESKSLESSSEKFSHYVNEITETSPPRPDLFEVQPINVKTMDIKGGGETLEHRKKRKV